MNNPDQHLTQGKYLFITKELLPNVNGQHPGWYEVVREEGKPETYRRLTNKECADVGLNHKTPPEGDSTKVVDNIPSEGDDTKPSATTEADVKSAAQVLHDESKTEHPVCAAAARRGERKFATHKVTLLDGSVEYRHISEIGTKSSYIAAMQLPD